MSCDFHFAEALTKQLMKCSVRCLFHGMRREKREKATSATVPHRRRRGGSTSRWGPRSGGGGPATHLWLTATGWGCKLVVCAGMEWRCFRMEMWKFEGMSGCPSFLPEVLVRIVDSPSHFEACPWHWSQQIFKAAKCYRLIMTRLQGQNVEISRFNSV